MLKEYKLYNGKVIIKFDDENHRFYGTKGEPLISVTGITGVIDKSRVLIYWAVGLMRDFLLPKVDRGITEQDILEASRQHSIFKKKSADIGTRIHEWVSDWIKGKNPKMPDDEQVVNGITAFLKFQRGNKIKWIESERVIYSKKYKYAGILDAVGKIGKDLVLIDFKSSNGVYDEMRFQVAGYQIAYEEETKKKIDRRIIARFGKDTGEFEAFELKDHQKDKKAFLACLELRRRLKELEQEKKNVRSNS